MGACFSWVVFLAVRLFLAMFSRSQFFQMCGFSDVCFSDVFFRCVFKVFVHLFYTCFHVFMCFQLLLFQMFFSDVCVFLMCGFADVWFR